MKLFITVEVEKKDTVQGQSLKKLCNVIDVAYEFYTDLMEKNIPVQFKVTTLPRTLVTTE